MVRLGKADMREPQSQPIYYGWKIVFAILVLLSFTSGLSFYNHSVYLNALSSGTNFDVRTASTAVSVFFLVGGISGLWIARWVQDYDVRLSITAGAVLCCLSVSALPYVVQVWQLFLVYGLFGTGFTASSLIPATTLVTRWFKRRRAMALSIASTGLSLGGVLLTPLSVVLVDSYGFAAAAPMIGALYLIGVIPVTWLWLRPSPESMGLCADGVQAPESPTAAAQRSSPTPATAEDGVSLSEARRGRLFWGISLGYVFLMLAQVGGIAHQFGLAREQLSEGQTAAVVAILPIASICGRLLGGWIVDQMSIRVFAAAMMVLQSCSLLLLAGGYSVLSLCVGLALFGTTVGNLLMLQPLLIAEAFGVRDYARIFSVNNLMSSWGTALGPAVMGFVYTLNGDAYAAPYAVAAAAGLAGMMLFLSAGTISRPQLGRTHSDANIAARS